MGCVGWETENMVQVEDGTDLSPTNSQTIPVRMPPPKARSSMSSPVVNFWSASCSITSFRERGVAARCLQYRSIIVFISEGGRRHLLESSEQLLVKRSMTSLNLPEGRDGE